MTYIHPLAALADPTRRQLYARLRRRPHAVGELAKALKITQPAVSQHLSVLRKARLVQSRAEGTKRWYQPTRSKGARALVYTPVIKIVTIRADQSRAFSRFTSEMASWWPLPSHSVGGLNSEAVVMENHVGGRIVERIRGGGESVWGTITVWDPPRRIAFTWHPGDPPGKATNVEVRFVAVDGARTRVELEHVGFERLGEMAKKARRGYPIGWAYVLGLYAERRGPFMLAVTGLTTALMWITRRRASAVRRDLA